MARIRPAYLHCVEIVPILYRGQAISIANHIFWLIAFVEVLPRLLTLKYQPVREPSPSSTLLGPTSRLVVVMWLVKETKALLLEQVDLFGRHKIVRIPTLRPLQLMSM